MLHVKRWRLGALRLPPVIGVGASPATTAVAGVVIAAAAVLALSMPAVAAAPPVVPPGGNVKERLAGADRFGTAVAASKRAHPGTVPVVYLASGSDFPDALSVGPIVAKRGGSLLLTGRNELPAEAAAEIKRLKPDRVVLVGGTAAITAKVERAVSALVGEVARVGGADRYETSRELAASAFDGTAPSVFIATGRGYADALSAGAAAATAGGPVLLVDGHAAALDAATTALVKKLGPSRITVVGGRAVMPDGVVTDAAKLASEVTRVAGDDRFATSAALASTWGAVTEGYVASGEDYPDALVASALAGAVRVPLFVIGSRCQPAVTFASQNALGITEVTVLGGQKSIASDATATICTSPQP